MTRPVIMAEGSGTRLWLLSRAGHRKQFLVLNEEKTMLQQTAVRLSDFPASESIAICNEEHRFFVTEQLREIDALGKIILEPMGRNIAPVIALAAKATSGEKTFLLSEDESTYIPIGAVHALESPGKVAREIIEIQSSSYSREDGIIRFEDSYGWSVAGTETGS